MGAGPGGDSIYIDGFSGGQLPPEDAIHKIHINQNPFAPEYDKLGYGRVEILTKPGANKFHGTGYYNFGDGVWNSRNPYAAEEAPFLLAAGLYGTSWLTHDNTLRQTGIGSLEVLVDADRLSVC